MKEKKAKVQKKCGKAAKDDSKTISYRLKCAKTANGLSHYVMYGDMAEKETLL